MKYFILLALLLTSCGHGATMMGVCEVSHDKIYLPEPGAVSSRVCVKPTVIRWSKVPLVVKMETEIADDYAESVGSAMSLWNDWLGFPVFTFGDDADVTITVSVSQGKDLGATAFFRDDAGRLHATVGIRNPGDVTSVYYVVVHELGHVLGLAHDFRNAVSVMSPVLDYQWDKNPGPDGDLELRWVLVMEEDRAMLRNMYR